MGVCDSQLIFNSRAVLEQDFDSSAKRLFAGVSRMITARPFFVFPSFNAAPEPDRIRAAGAFRRIALDVVPAAILKSHCENVHDGMIERFPTGLRIELLWIVRAGANHTVCVVASMDDHFFDLRE